MISNAMSLKAKIRNYAKSKKTSPQVILQNYMFERFLERLSKSEYHDNFILKGGILIASIVGIDNRSTMDMDATIKNYPFEMTSISKAIREICNVLIDDDVTFELKSIDLIRNDDSYGGYRVGIVSKYDSIVTPMQIDITTGDVITPKEVQYSYKKTFTEGNIGIWAYNLETVLAEKVETILHRGELNTRPRDFYDVFILTKTQVYDQTVFSNALRTTAEHRKTSHIYNEMDKRLNEIAESATLSTRWNKYTIDYKYADGIAYENIIESLKELLCL